MNLILFSSSDVMEMSVNCKSFFKEDSIQNLLLGEAQYSGGKIREL
jgi:hypothetical protein